jgi:hypothetical protein
MYKLKERSYRVVLKNMHYFINPEEIKTEIENLGHTVTNIWNIKQYRTKLPLSIFFAELKPQCANSQRYGHTKNYCHLKPRWVKCAGDHVTNQCHRKERSNDVRCVLCGKNHLANYKGCTVYKDLQKKTWPPLPLKQYTPPAQIKQTLHTQPGVT